MEGADRRAREHDAERRRNGAHDTPATDRSAPTRREFLRTVVGSTAALAAGSGAGLPAILTACDDSVGAEGPVDDNGRNRLRLPDPVAPRDLVLRAATGTADIGGGVSAPTWLLNGSLPSPLLRVRRGDPVRITLQNELPQDLILHWHGLTPPELMDGHPRLAVPPGGTYQYTFSVENRPATYWYHPHTHMRTAEQTYRGMAGLLIVEDPAEVALGLPTGEREIPLILQDRRVDGAGVPYYEPFGPDFVAGYMGGEAFANGIRRAFLDVDSAVYRFRILNGSNARIFRIGRGDGQPILLVGTDGGLLPASHSLASVDVAPAERVDLLVDLRGVAVGQRVMLRSLPFSIPGGGGFMGGANLQGQALDLLELRVTREVQDPLILPTSLPAVPGPDPSAAIRVRTFDFQSQGMDHRINEQAFALQRIDEHVPFGDTEIWRFVNDSNLSHPVHLHATHFRVVSRSGGRGVVLPWEEGPKDTVLLYPDETVEAAVRFEANRGLFLLHCHNLEHEDMGMMANILVE